MFQFLLHYSHQENCWEFCLFSCRKKQRIDTDKTILPRGADKNEKMVFQTVVKRSEICSIESTFHEGKRIVSDDCFFHAL